MDVSWTSYDFCSKRFVVLEAALSTGDVLIEAFGLCLIAAQDVFEEQLQVADIV